MIPGKAGPDLPEFAVQKPLPQMSFYLALNGQRY
jgi:hypothetical protein